ncbi:NAD-dependent succinate-semialdehyde dehydrogenase [Rhodococcus koreensis]
MTTTTAARVDPILGGLAVPTGLLIDGTWRDAADGKTFPVTNPATGETIALIADGGPEDADAALAAAARAQSTWAATAPRERSEILRRAYDLLIERGDFLATVVTTEMGKPFDQAQSEVVYAAEFLRWFSEEAVRIGGDHTITGNGADRIIVTSEPVGPCVLVTPWNFPLAMGTRKIGPAVAAGCTVMMKPAEQTPLTMLALAQIMQEAGLPDGVLNVVNTSDPGSVVTPWMSSGTARKISFTGSTEVGKLLLRQAADTVMHSSMELGGNAPFIVCADADIDKAVDGAVTAKMRNMGEACTAANRFYVHRSVAATFAERLAARMAEMKVSNGFDEGTDVGPLIDPDAQAKVQGLVDDAVGRGATVLTGGTAPDTPGYFYLPTVLTDVPTDSRFMTTEIFGPVAPVIPFDDEDEVIRIANNSDWGLAGYIFTQDIDRAFDLGERLEVGMVGLNTGLVSNPAAPFGGVKQSGLGREGGKVGIEEFLEYKYFAVPRRRAV